jgi:hypothetical protein
LVLLYNPRGVILINESVNINEPNQVIYISPTEISVDDVVKNSYFYIHSVKLTIRTLTINWEITPDLPSWLSVSPMSGNFIYGLQKIRLYITSEGLASRQYTHTITIISNFGNDEITIVLNKE